MTVSGGRQVVVVGAGLAGSLLALLLARRGFQVTILERRNDPRQTGAEEGRSINLAISARGLAALAAVGLRESVEAISILLPGRRIHGRDGSIAFQPYGRTGQGIRSVHRADLNTMLLDAAERAGVAIRFRCRVTGIDLAKGEVALGDGQEAERVTAGPHGFVVGGDGAFSVVRSAMQRLDRAEYAQSFLTHGYKELVIPPAEGGGHRLDPHAMHIWPRGGYMMMAMANRDGSFTVTLYLPFEGPNGFSALGSAAEVRHWFEAEFPDAVPHLPDLERDFAANPTGSLVTIRCAPWSVTDRVVLVGDACHAVVPFYGQGANAAFEDCLVLDECLAEWPGDLAGAFRAYEARRKEHTDALADLAVDNFIEMRDKVASPAFRWKKRLERFLHGLLPSAFLPLYTMVSFTRIPYADARRRARRQWRVVTLIGATLMALLLAGLFTALR